MEQEHNHIPIPEKIDAIPQMVERVKITRERPRAIMKTCQLGVGVEAAPYMVRPDAIRQRIQRVRRNKVDYGPNPV